MFTADHFTPTKWDTADDKAWFANHFVKFVKSGFEQRHFTDRLYRRLSNMFGHIAHYNRLGFWEEFFVSTEGKAQFLDIALRHPCYGDAAWTYSDVERVLQSWCKRRSKSAALGGVRWSVEKCSASPARENP